MSAATEAAAKAKAEAEAKAKAAAKGIPAAGAMPFIPNKEGKVKTYIWSVDSKGNLIKVEATTAKKSFATLTEQEQTALAQQLIATNIVPTVNAAKSLWDKLVDGATASYKGGKQETPWDVLKTLAANTPINTGITGTQIREYDPVTANAYLNNIALSIGFDATQLSDKDRADFATKIKEAAGSSGKITQRTVTASGTETVVTPDVFDPKTFAENWLWAKVNFNDVTKLPTKAITALTSVKQILRGNGIDYLSDAEVSKIAVNIASGKEDINALKIQFADEASKYYPLLASRLKANPGLSVMDILSPAVSQIAKWLEIDPTTIDLTNPYLDNYARPDGLAGKVDMPSMADFITKLKNSPESEKTTWKNEAARSAATSMASAMGYPI